MVFVIDCLAIFFDLQCIVGDCGLTEAEDFLAQKRCFGLTDPINAVYSVNALTKSFWNVFGAEAKEELGTSRAGVTGLACRAGLDGSGGRFEKSPRCVVSSSGRPLVGGRRRRNGMLGASSGCNSISLSTPSLPGRLPLVETIHNQFISRLAACVFSFLAFTKPSQISLIELIVVLLTFPLVISPHADISLKK
jgi:hypothetical protein